LILQKSIFQKRLFSKTLPLVIKRLVGLAICFSSLVFAADKFQSTVPGLISYEMPRFPPELVGIKAGDGDVVMVVTMDSTGAVNDSLVLEATNEAFARSATRSVNNWRFSTESSLPATPSADATFPRREVLQFSFRRSGVVTTLSHAEAARENFVASNIPEVHTVRWNQLDAEPQRISAAMPKVSKAILATHGAQPLTINFVIDREGRVRVPVVPAWLHLELANAVLAAVRSWRYTPPLYQQQPVTVEVTKAMVLPQK